MSEQVWELYGNVYCGSWLIICPARSPGELLGGSGELSEAVPDHWRAQRAPACIASAAWQHSARSLKKDAWLGLAWLGLVLLLLFMLFMQ